jgi:uncharacterized protein YyaL (SSP411 family)
VLSVADSDLSTADQELLASAKRKMLAERARRVRPHLDDKILASWNGLMLAPWLGPRRCWVNRATVEPPKKISRS